MNELKINNNKEQLTPIEIALQIDEDGRTTSRKLYEFLELDKSNYSRWVKKNIINNEFAEENNDYFALVIDDERDFNPNPTKDFKLSAEFAKKLAMGSHTLKGEEARNYFVQVEDKLKEITKTMRLVLSDKDKAILNIVNATSDIERANAISYYDKVVTKPLLDQLDKYERFLCEKTGMLTKAELAIKLDCKPQTLASKLKKAKVYTPTSQISADFLKRYPNEKLIIECDNVYKDKNGNEHTKSGFQWTFSGAKTVVDYLVELDMVSFTENNGFKLKE